MSFIFFFFFLVVFSTTDLPKEVWFFFFFPLSFSPLLFSFLFLFALPSLSSLSLRHLPAPSFFYPCCPQGSVLSSLPKLYSNHHHHAKTTWYSLQMQPAIVLLICIYIHLWGGGGVGFKAILVEQMSDCDYPSGDM